jgi:hypothetical protein
MRKRKLVSFDWAMKRLLRSKANYEVLEGFLSELLKEDITILEVLESESNKVDKYDKFNRVDLKAVTGTKEIGGGKQVVLAIYSIISICFDLYAQLYKTWYTCTQNGKTLSNMT